MRQNATPAASCTEGMNLRDEISDRIAIFFAQADSPLHRRNQEPNPPKPNAAAKSPAAKIPVKTTQPSRDRRKTPDRPSSGTEPDIALRTVSKAVTNLGISGGSKRLHA